MDSSITSPCGPQDREDEDVGETVVVWNIAWPDEPGEGGTREFMVKSPIACFFHFKQKRNIRSSCPERPICVKQVVRTIALPEAADVNERAVVEAELLLSPLAI